MYSFNLKTVSFHMSGRKDFYLGVVCTFETLSEMFALYEG